MKQIVLAAGIVVLIASFVGVRVAVTASGENAGDLACHYYDDEYEDNETPGTAYQVPAPVSLTTLYLCPGNYDVFRFNASPGATIDIEATFIQADGDVDISLARPHSAGFI